MSATDSQIKNVIGQLKVTSLGEAMKHFKLNHANQCDSLTVKNLFGEL